MRAKTTKRLGPVRLQSLLYSAQMLSLLVSAGILGLQYELFMLDRGISLEVALIIFSVGQALILSSNIFVRRLLDKIEDSTIILKIGIVVRTVTMLSMFLVGNPYVFIGLFLVYQTFAVSNIIFESRTATWCFDNEISFSNLRLYGSFGFAVSGFIVSFLFWLTGDINTMLLFLFLLNLFNLIVIFGSKSYKSTPKKVATSTNEPVEAPKAISVKLRTLLILCAITLSFANAFSVILNNHYRYFFNLPIDNAILMVSVSVLLGSFISEIVGLKSVDKLVARISARKTVFIGIALSLCRWVMASFAPTYVTFAMSFVFHGFTFAYVYMGALAYAKNRYGNHITQKIVLELIIYINIFGITFVQLTNLIVNLFDTQVVLFLYAGLNALAVAVFGVVFMLPERKKKELVG